MGGTGRDSPAIGVPRLPLWHGLRTTPSGYRFFAECGKNYVPGRVCLLQPSAAMKRLFLRLQRHRALRRIRRQEQPAVPVYVEMSRGSLIGLVVCLLGAIAIGGRSGPALWAGLFGAGIGALSGLLVWLGSDQLAEQPVIPPHRARWRPEYGPPHRFPQRPLHQAHPVSSSSRPPHHTGSARHPVRPHAHRQR